MTDTVDLRAAVTHAAFGLAAHGFGFRPGASTAAIDDAEKQLARPLPRAVREYFESSGGTQDGAEVLLYGGRLCSLAETVDEWRSMTELQNDGSFDGFEIDAEPDPGIRGDQWWRDGWMPLVARDGDFLVLDLDPASEGTVGQIFAWSRLDGAGTLAAPGISSWVDSWASEMETATPPDSVADLVHPPGSAVWPIRD